MEPCATLRASSPPLSSLRQDHAATQLAELASQIVATFETLLVRLLDSAQLEEPGSAPDAGPAMLPPSPLTVGMTLYRRDQKSYQQSLSAAASMPGGGGAGAPSSCSTASLLLSFDELWVQYLDHFVAWKQGDAASLEAELVRS